MTRTGKSNMVKQLAAERDRATSWEAQDKRSYSKLYVDLAEAKMDNETLTDALKKIVQLTDVWMMREIAEAALAKAKEGK
jgi:hypothetical protein